MNRVTLILTFLLSLSVVGCKYENGRVFKQGDVVLEQWSPTMSEWQGVTLFYGFGLNEEMCEKAKESNGPHWLDKIQTKISVFLQYEREAQERSNEKEAT
jgi:hypothetical protein